MNKLYLIMCKYRKLFTVTVAALFIIGSLFNIVFCAEALDNLNHSLESLATNIRSYAGVLCVICGVYIGVTFVFSAINPKLKDHAKGGLWGLLFGVLILLYADQVAYIIAELLGTDSSVLNRR